MIRSLKPSRHIGTYDVLSDCFDDFVFVKIHSRLNVRAEGWGTSSPSDSFRRRRKPQSCSLSKSPDRKRTPAALESALPRPRMLLKTKLVPFIAFIGTPRASP